MPRGDQRGPKRGTTLALAVVLLTAGLLGGGAGAAPLGRGESAAPGIVLLPDGVEPEASMPGSIFGGSLFRRRVEAAMGQIRAELGGPRGRSCRTYFSELGVDVVAWLDLTGPPFIKEVPGRRGRDLDGIAQAGPPFQWVFIRGRGARSADACRLGSLLLHELGHLARRDVTDNEPPEFFSRCRLSACIDAGRYR